MEAERDGGNAVAGNLPPPTLHSFDGAAAPPLRRGILYVMLAFLMLVLAWVTFGKLDRVAVAPGKVVPQRYLKVVQPAESGIVREILVDEGARVEAGAVLLRMDAQLSDADRRILQAELALRNLQLRRVAAELGEGALVRQSSDPPDLFVQIESQYRSRARAHADVLASEQALVAKARQDLDAALQVEAKLRRTAPIFAEQERAWSDLEREGFAGRLLALDRQRARIENEQDLKAQAATVAGLRAAIDLGEKRIAQLVSGYRRELTTERGELSAQRDRLVQDLSKHGHRAGLLELRSPVRGRVKDLATHTPGTVVAPGTVLATVVPEDEPLEAEIWISNLDAGLVRSGAKVRVKVAAYPFQRFGSLDGTVRHLSADATDRGDPAGARAVLGGLHYRALVSLSGSGGNSASSLIELAPGMQVSAEIHLGTRTILEYLMSPFTKILGEAGREP